MNCVKNLNRHGKIKQTQRPGKVKSVSCAFWILPVVGATLIIVYREPAAGVRHRVQAAERNETAGSQHQRLFSGGCRSVLRH